MPTRHPKPAKSKQASRKADSRRIDPEDEEDLADVVRHGMYGDSCSKPFEFRATKGKLQKPPQRSRQQQGGNIPERPELYHRIALDAPLDGKFEG